MDASAAEKPKENPVVVPEDKRAALAALSERIKSQDPVSAARLNDVEKKAEVLIGLRELSQMVESGRVTSVTKAEVDAIHDSIEAPFLVSTRPVEDLAQNALDAMRGMNPEVKKAVLATGVVGGGILGVLGLGKLWRGAKKVAVETWDTTLDVGEKVVTKTASFLGWLLKTATVAGVGALTLVGVQRALAPGQAPAETPKKTA